MNKNDLLCIFHGVNSPWGLRYRATKIENCDYREFLEILAASLEQKLISRQDVAGLIEIWRDGNPDLAITFLKNLTTRGNF